MAHTAARRGTPPPTIESPRDRERLRTVVFPEHSDLAAAVADRIVEVIQRETRARGRVVLGLATGSTPLGVYEELIRRHQAGEGDFAHVITFNLDEYYPMGPDSAHSYRRYMWENFFAHVNIPKENVHIPDGTTPREHVAESCAAYDAAIRTAGGIDFQLLGIGKTGHVGFNEPGSDATSRTRIVTLDTLKRKDAAADFFGVENVPREAITMGVATILDAKEIALLATGEHKAGIVARAVEGEISTDVAATFLQRHGNVTVYLDLPAAADLTRIKTPWLLEAVEWSPALVERSVVWLPGRTGEGGVKLSGKDQPPTTLAPTLAHGESVAQALRQGLRREPAVAAAGTRGIGRADQRPGVQSPARQDPRAREAAGPRARSGVLPASRRRRHLDGRDPSQAVGEREPDGGRVHDERQHRRVRPRRDAPPGLRGTRRGVAGPRHEGGASRR